MKGIVDRFEGDIVVIEIDGQPRDFPRHSVDKDVKAGDVVELLENVWIKNATETVRRSQEIKKLMDDVWDE
ncbi:DUF3006 domain-containing protein [Cohnella sp. AR92]|nr:DUF3006 domain-containing protein [Cohnella sp. AR92]